MMMMVMVMMMMMMMMLMMMINRHPLYKILGISKKKLNHLIYSVSYTFLRFCLEVWSSSERVLAPFGPLLL